jgi:hypothetical protein
LLLKHLVYTICKYFKYVMYQLCEKVVMQVLMQSLWKVG